MEVVMAIASALENVGHSGHSEGLGRILRAVITVEGWFERHRQRRSLLGLDDHMLHDIGRSRADVESEVRKHFWEP
jgi:uncharacterized protein YjiS (DUF1127 family)